MIHKDSPPETLVVWWCGNCGWTTLSENRGLPCITCMKYGGRKRRVYVLA